MPSHLLSDDEKDLLKVVKNEIDYAQNTPSLASTQVALENSIAESEILLCSIGREHELEHIGIQVESQEHTSLIIRSFDDLLKDAIERYPQEISFEDIFASAELAANAEYIRQLITEFDAVHRLDVVDVTIPVVAGILSGAIDCVFGGFVNNANGVNVPGTLSDFVQKLFNKALPPEKIARLEEIAKVPYDAFNYDNKGNVIVGEIVDGLSPMFHHQVSLGHDPILGFIFGVLDMLRGTLTTLDFQGKISYSNSRGF